MACKYKHIRYDFYVISFFLFNLAFPPFLWALGDYILMAFLFWKLYPFLTKSCKMVFKLLFLGVLEFNQILIVFYVFIRDFQVLKAPSSKPGIF